MKIRTSPRFRCNDCYFAQKKGRLYVRCRSQAKHKQRQHKKVVIKK